MDLLKNSNEIQSGRQLNKTLKSRTPFLQFQIIFKIPHIDLDQTETTSATTLPELEVAGQENAKPKKQTTKKVNRNPRKQRAYHGSNKTVADALIATRQAEKQLEQWHSPLMLKGDERQTLPLHLRLRHNSSGAKRRISPVSQQNPRNLGVGGASVPAAHRPPCQRGDTNPAVAATTTATAEEKVGSRCMGRRTARKTSLWF